MRYVWDSAKEAANLKRRGIDFVTAAKVFADPNAITDYDADHGHDRQNQQRHPRLPP